jgi:DNA-binding HxlR family transcriptional regulator
MEAHLATSDATAGRADESRAGGRIISLFANPLNARVLRAHSNGPKRLAQLHEEIGWSAHTTLRASVATLREVGALSKQRLSGMPYAVENWLTPAGEEMLFAAETLEAWLARAPEGPIAADSEAAKSAVKALAGGWSSTLIHALAARPYSLTELDSLIPDISYPSLERRLAKMRITRQVTQASGEGRSTPYVVSDWLRRSIAPLCVAGRCERRHMSGFAAPITNVEVEAAFLLAVPLVSLPRSVTGACTLAVHTGDEVKGDRDHLAGVTVEVERGEVASCIASVAGPATWALGTPETWLDVVIDGDLEGLRFGGAKPRLAADLVNGIRIALFDGAVDPIDVHVNRRA